MSRIWESQKFGYKSPKKKNKKKKPIKEQDVENICHIIKKFDMTPEVEFCFNILPERITAKNGDNEIFSIDFYPVKTSYPVSITCSKEVSDCASLISKKYHYRLYLADEKNNTKLVSNF